MRTTTLLIDWASCWTSPGVAPEGGAVELPEDIPPPASSAKRTASPADSRRYRMALPLFAWAGMGPIIAPRAPMSRSAPDRPFRGPQSRYRGRGALVGPLAGLTERF